VGSIGAHEDVACGGAGHGSDEGESAGASVPGEDNDALVAAAETGDVDVCAVRADRDAARSARLDLDEAELSRAAVARKDGDGRI
jgi:hypothetical protein